MATTAKWATPETETEALGSGLNSLADAAFAVSTAIDNETGLYTHMDLEVNLASFTPGAGQPYVAVYILYSIDGTNYSKEPDASSGDDAPIATFPLEASVAQASRPPMSVNIPIAPLKFKLSLRNMAGAALASSGNTLKYSRHNMQGV